MGGEDPSDYLTGVLATVAGLSRTTRVLALVKPATAQ
jgi:hypothetical protein